MISGDLDDLFCRNVNPIGPDLAELFGSTKHDQVVRAAAEQELDDLMLVQKRASVELKVFRAAQAH